MLSVAPSMEVGEILWRIAARRVSSISPMTTAAKAAIEQITASRPRLARVCVRSSCSSLYDGIGAAHAGDLALYDIIGWA